MENKIRNNEKNLNELTEDKLEKVTGGRVIDFKQVSLDPMNNAPAQKRPIETEEAGPVLKGKAPKIVP